MTLRLLKGRNGKIRKNWYGKIHNDGKTEVVNLGVKVKGCPPKSLRQQGDAAFELSRGRAQEKLNRLVEDASEKQYARLTLEKLFTLQTGTEVEYKRIDELAQAWRNRGGKSPTERYLKICDAMFKRFADYCAQLPAKPVYLHQVTRDMAKNYADDLLKGLSPKTVRGHVTLLRGAFRHFAHSMVSNPFDNIQISVPHHEQIGRKALTVDELELLIEIAEKDDPLLADAIKCCAYTGLRKSDAMNLKWSSVEGNVLRVPTSKTGAEVVIPIFPPMREVLEKKKGLHPEYIFPELQSINQKTPEQLTRRFKVLAVKMMNPPDPELKDAERYGMEPDQILVKGLEYIRTNVPEKRRRRVRETFIAYMSGDSYPVISESTGRTRSSISYDIHEVQDGIGADIVRKKNLGSVRSSLGPTRSLRKKGGRRASVVDWHCLRTTFATIALENGMKEAHLLSITGHTSMQTVIRHYRKIREEERMKEYEKLPSFFTGTRTTT